LPPSAPLLCSPRRRLFAEAGQQCFGIHRRRLCARHCSQSLLLPTSSASAFHRSGVFSLADAVGPISPIGLIGPIGALSLTGATATRDHLSALRGSVRSKGHAPQGLHPGLLTGAPSGRRARRRGLWVTASSQSSGALRLGIDALTPSQPTDGAPVASLCTPGDRCHNHRVKHTG
jgi:hypothetical protein